MAFSGLVAEIPLGVDGLTGNVNHATVKPTELLRAENVSYESGTVRKEGGAEKYNSSALSGTPSILGGWDWHPVSGTQRMIILTSAGALLKDTGGGTFSVTLASGLTVSSVIPVFVEGGKEAAAGDRKLFVFTGKNAVQVLAADGATTAAIGTPPADWSGGNQPAFGVNHEDRIWGGGNANDPHRVYYSTTGDHEDFTGAGSGSISIYPGEGDKLIGAVSFKGTLICWKYPRGIYAIDTTPVAVADWKVSRLSREIGGVSPLGMVPIDNDIVFMDPTGGFHAITAVTEFGNLGTKTIDTDKFMLEFIRREMNLANLPLTHAIFYPAKDEVHFCLPGTGSSVNNRRMVMDLSRFDALRWRFSSRDTNVSIWLRRDSDGVPRPMIGDNAGFVWYIDQDARSKDSAGYNGQFQTPHLDLSHLDPSLGTKVKYGKFLELVVEPTGEWDVSADIYWDGTYSETVAFNMGSNGSALGSFVLGTDILGSEGVLNKKRRIHGGGRRISILFRNSGNGQDFSIAKMYLHFAVGGERLDG